MFRKIINYIGSCWGELAVLRRHCTVNPQLRRFLLPEALLPPVASTSAEISSVPSLTKIQEELLSIALDPETAK